MISHNSYGVLQNVANLSKVHSFPNSHFYGTVRYGSFLKLAENTKLIYFKFCISQCDLDYFINRLQRLVKVLSLHDSKKCHFSVKVRGTFLKQAWKYVISRNSYGVLQNAANLSKVYSFPNSHFYGTVRYGTGVFWNWRKILS